MYKNNFILATTLPKNNKYRIKFLELIANKIYSEENNYILKKIENNNINLTDIVKKGTLQNKEYEIIFYTKENFVEYLNSRLKDFDEYLSINLLNWFYNYSTIFLNKENSFNELNKIIYDLSMFIPDINFIYFRKNDFLIEYIDYFISDLLVDINLNYLESSFVYELKQAILGLLLSYMENVNIKNILDDLIEIVNSIVVYEKIYNIRSMNIINKIIKNCD